MGPRKRPLTQKYGFFDFWGLFRGWRPVFWPELLLKSCLPTSKLLLGKIWDPILKISKKSPPRRKKYFFEKKISWIWLIFHKFRPPHYSFRKKKSTGGHFFLKISYIEKYSHFRSKNSVWTKFMGSRAIFTPKMANLAKKSMFFGHPRANLGVKKFFWPQNFDFWPKKNFEKKNFLDQKIFWVA